MLLFLCFHWICWKLYWKGPMTPTYSNFSRKKKCIWPWCCIPLQAVGVLRYPLATGTFLFLGFCNLQFIFLSRVLDCVVFLPVLKNFQFKLTPVWTPSTTANLTYWTTQLQEEMLFILVVLLCFPPFLSPTHFSENDCSYKDWRSWLFFFYSVVSG